MKLTHSSIITGNVKKLVEFYQNVLQLEAQCYGDDYAEFETGCGILAIYDIKSYDALAPGSAKNASNRSIILEFNVEDVDKEYKRLQELDVDWVKGLTTQEWGNRSTYFRDPDGNLINFYTRIKK